ncbi:RNA ligase family protein [Pseudoruegeria sp. SK021]|uniref:RNA ligase family protein n=1 Tax=Pseudoruegeria sp. SK021 TaxID=1933035 RepID=UPI000A22F685|nr:RNA ligase family protein [Pseudoruegeria sp. SK021]OSP53509.1 hypothetical protein BV911_17655 [Pseudoruegeria sp. SK021]
MMKYGRTFHLPTSPGTTSDDKIMTSLNGLMVDDLLVTEKMDGENTTIHCSGTHARSPDSRYHPSRNWIKRFAANISPFLAENERIVGENLFARHSIAYDALPSYFLGFAWVVDGEVRPWDLTLSRFKSLGITPVPTLYRGPFKNGLFEDLASELDTSKHEGFVVRVAGAYCEADMQTYMGKYVRKGHVQSDKHWMHADLIRNSLAPR